MGNKLKSKEELLEIAKNFKIIGTPIDIENCESGHINQTYQVGCKDGNKNTNYILQYVNTNVFPNLKELMKNIEKVTEYIKKTAKEKGEYHDRITINFIETKNGDKPAIYDENWRMEEFIKDTRTFLKTDDLDVLYEARKIVGEFQKYLDGFPAQELFEIIPKFHYTPNRYNNLIKAIKLEENNCKRKERFEKAKKIIEFLTDSVRKEKIDIITKGLEKNEIPLRVTHNDTKLSNILFDKETQKSVCLIDLDTVMPGAIAYDFGEAIRTCISRTKEDEQDLSKIKLEMDRFEAFTKGFLSNLKNTLTKEEKQQLVLGAWMMTYENALRFLTDYLNGDTYFHVDKSIQDHNLARTASQAELLRQIEENNNEMERLINKYGF